MESLMIFVLGLLFAYLFILKGLPWIASKYASYRFGAQVGVKTIDFISRSLRDVSFRTSLLLNGQNNPEEATVALAIDEVLLSTNFFSDIYSTLIVIKMNGVRLNTQVDSLSVFNNKYESDTATFHTSTQNDLSCEEENQPNKQLQKFVECVSYLKFVVTFVVTDIRVTLDTRDEQDPITAASFAASAIKILPESMRNGLVNLSINIEESMAEICDGNSRTAKLSLEKANTNTIIHVVPPEIDTFEFKSISSKDGSGMLLSVSLSFAATYFNWQRQHERNSSLLKNNVKNGNETNIIQSLPNLEVNLNQCQIQILDDESHGTKRNDVPLKLLSTFCDINLNFDKTDILLAVDMGSYSMECEVNSSTSSIDQFNKILDVRTAKARKSPSILSASWNLCQFRCDLHQASALLSMLHKFTLYSQTRVRFKDSPVSSSYSRNIMSADYFTRSLLQVNIVQGTFDQPSSDMTVVQMQCLSAILGDSSDYEEDYFVQPSTFGQQGSTLNSIDIEALHCTLDYEQHEAYLTTTQINTYVSQAPLKVAFNWVRFVFDIKDDYGKIWRKFQLTKNNEYKDVSTRKKWNKTSFRAGNSNTSFRLPNGIEVKFATGTIKIKHKTIRAISSSNENSVKNASCKGISLSMWSLTGAAAGSTGTPRAMLKRVIAIPSVSVTKGNIDNGDGTQVIFLEKIKCCWSTLIHKVFVEVISIVKEEIATIKQNLDADSSQQDGVVNQNPTTSEKFHVKFDNGFDISTKLQSQTVNVCCQKTLTFNRYTKENWKLNMPRMTINVDELTQPGDLVRLDDILIIGTTGAHQLAKQYRGEIDNLEQKVNSKSIIISMAHCEFAFPHQVNIHNLFSDEFLGIYKWLKIIHNKSGTEWDKIHPDILVFIKQISVEFQDDPFEVQLRDNFELLEDEFKESKKREKCLNNRIDDLKKTHFMLPSTKIEELFNNLTKKNSDIYVQRAKSLKNNVNKRTRLLSLNITSMELCIFSDQSMTGKKKILNFIRTVDSESPWTEDLDFVSAFYKWIRFECKAASIMLRDYPQSFAEAKNVVLWGRAAFADQTPMERAIREHIIDQGKPYYSNFTLNRSLLSFKLYHDIAMDMNYAAFAHGPCWEATLAQFSISISYVTGKSQDPSPGLAWWDKYRYLFHGRFLCGIKTLKLLLHTTLDPYNTTEEVELCLSEANLDWTNDGLLTCGANLDLFVRTASKYDDCHLLHVSNFLLTCKFDWICIGNPRDHHNIMLCAKEKVPEYYGHSEGHDSWRAFRSKNVNLRLTLETKIPNLQKISTGSENVVGYHRASSGPQDRARLEMYSSTLRWLESLKWLFSGASRPIRRGNIFPNPQDPKQSFFRHFRSINCSCSLYQMQIDYWTSASKTKGVLVNVANGLMMSSEYSLKLVRPNDGLIHRPRSEWTIGYTNCQMGTSDIWFQCMKESSNPGQDHEEVSVEHQIPLQFSSERQIEKSFFFSVEDVQYKYSSGPNPFTQCTFQRSASGNDKSPSHILIVNGAKGAWTESNRDMAYALYDSWRRALILRGQVSGEGIKALLAPPAQTSLTSPIEDNASYRNGKKESKLDNSVSLSNIESENNGELSFSSLGKEWTGSVQEMIELASKGGGGGCVPIVYSEDHYTSVTDKKKELDAMSACQKDDVVFTNWSISFINSQMLLKGIETRGHLIMSAAKAHVEHNLHKPVWINDSVFSKSSWVRYVINYF